MNRYFYGVQSEQFSFFRVPTILFTDEKYKDVSPEAKILYGILLSRMELSAKNGWIDELGRVYIIYPISGIMDKMNCADNKATKLMNELEEKCDLIERKRQGQGKPSLIYVKNFLPEETGVDEPAESRFKTRENHDFSTVKITNPESLKTRARYKDRNYNNQRYIKNLIYQKKDGIGMNDYEQYKLWFSTELELEALSQRYPEKKETLDGILDLLAETCSSKKEEICITGDYIPRDVVISRLMKLNSTHIQYVLECMKENKSDVRNIKRYLLTSLFNAPVTISSYYEAKVNHDLYGRHPVNQ